MTQKAASQTNQAAKASAASQIILQRAAVNDAPIPDVPAVVHEVLRSPGRALDRATRTFMEPRFGHDFSGVRVHTDDRAAASARAVNALAYTVGRDIVLGQGQYAPQSQVGQRLLAHELAHVVQQGGDASSVLAAPDELEASARTASEAVTSGGTTVRVAGRSAPMLARDAAPPAAGLSPLNVGDKEGLLLVMEAVQNIKPSSNASGLYTLAYQGRTITLTQAQRDELSKTASKALADGLSKAGSKARFAMGAYKAQKDVDADHYVVAPVVKFFGGVHDPGEELKGMVSTVSDSVVIGRDMLARGDFQKAAAALADAEAAAVKASRLSASYREDIISAGESQIKVLEFTRDASFVTLGVLAVIATGGAAAGATTTLFGAEVGTVATANLIATAAPIVATVGGALTQVALGDKVDWAKVGVDIAVNLVLSRFGGKLSQGLFKVMLGNPAVRGLGALAFGRIVSSVLTHEVSTAFTTTVDAGYRKLRGQNVTWDTFTDDLIARLSDPKGVAIAAVMGAVVTGVEAKPVGAAPTGKPVTKAGDPTENAPGPASRRTVPPKEISASPASSGGVVTGRSLPAFMRNAERAISDPEHLLHFLLKSTPGPGGKVTLKWRTTTRTTGSGKIQTGRYQGNEEGVTVQAGHQGAKASGVAEQFMLEDADLNQLTGQTIESKGAFSFKDAVVIGGVPVDTASAEQWERLGLLPPGTVARSSRIAAPSL